MSALGGKRTLELTSEQSCWSVASALVAYECDTRPASLLEEAVQPNTNRMIANARIVSPVPIASTYRVICGVAPARASVVVTCS
jgi:hypothetical protein